MEPINRYSLESFAERHRADFDLHEPRPELWNALEKQLDAEAAIPSREPQLSLVAETALVGAPRVQPALRVRRRWRYLEAACAVLVLAGAAVLGEIWKSNQPEAAVEVLPLGAAPSRVADAALYVQPEVRPASENGPNSNARLDTAVHGMERYYTTQLADRRAQLSQLAPDTQAEWVQELVSLDSSYQQLRRELPQHPQPEVVLTAMNRNLQIRLDILDRQLELHGDGRPTEIPTGANSEFALADSRVAANEGSRHVR